MIRALPRAVRVYRVGGSVRDELLGRDPGDRDWVVVGATPEMMLASGFTPVGRDFPVFLHPRTRDEYALARTERKDGRGYRGFRFFATPAVTLEEDLRRRDLTINAMARGPDGVLIDPYGGEADLRTGILRHVSPAFAEDPLRVLRVARFAARFGFRIARATQVLMREIVLGGELATLAPERVWQELATGLAEAHPSRMLATLRACGALAALLPEIDVLYGPLRGARNEPAGRGLERALDRAALRGLALPVRYAVFTHDFRRHRAGKAAGRGPSPRTIVARVDTISRRLKVPVECRDAARIVARWSDAAARAGEIPAAALLDLLTGTDALRRPERLDSLVAACAVIAPARGDGASGGRPALRLQGALAALKTVDVAAIARGVIGERIATTARASALPGSEALAGANGAAIASALRAARIAALREWKRATG